MTQWWVNEGYPGILPGSNYGSGGNVAASGAVQMRSPIDAARAAQGKLPQAEYPDGYLGNITDRHTDKLAQYVSDRMNARSYQRGVHKGSRISPRDYLWPADGVQPDAGLMREAAGQRVGNVIFTPKFAPQGNPLERISHLGKTSGMASPQDLDASMAEAKKFGADPALNPIIIPDRHLPKYRIA